MSIFGVRLSGLAAQRCAGAGVVAMATACLLWAGVAAAQEERPPGRPSITSIMVRAQARCEVSVGDEEPVRLDPGTSQIFFLSPGEYDVVARDVESKDELFRQKVSVESGRVEIVKIDLPNDSPPHAGPIYSADDGLDWAREEHPQNVSWEEARRHCSELSLEERADWRLPTIEELESLCREHYADPRVRTSVIQPGNIFVWSASETAAGEIAILTLTEDCLRMSYGPTDAFRAVCVRQRGTADGPGDRP